MGRAVPGLALLALLVFGATSLLAQEPLFRIVTHPANALTSLPKEQASRLFLKKAATWGDGTKVIPVDLGETSSVRDAFSRQVHGKQTRSVKAYWLNQLFTGRLEPPTELGSDADVLSFVKANPGAIGYVSAAAATRGVKVLELTNGG